MGKYIILSLLFVVPSLCLAQSRVGYAYDAAGNRISRTIVMNMLAAKKQPQSIQKARVYNDMLAKCSIRISPNPTQGRVQVSITGMKSEDDCALTVYSAAGQLIEHMPVRESVTSIDLGAQPNGYYLLHIIINGEKTVWKIIKK